VFRSLPSARVWIAAALVAAGLAAAIWATVLNARLTTGAPQPPPPLAATELTPADLPPFEPQAKTSEVARRANPKTVRPQRPRVEVLRYTVQRGDSVFGIAKNFGLEPESILWGNYDTLNDDPDMLQPGLDLNILPVDGVLYQWQEGDTLDSVAAEFEVDPREIVDWPGNAIDPVEPEIKDGFVLVVPGGKRDSPVAGADHRGERRRRGVAPAAAATSGGAWVGASSGRPAITIFQAMTIGPATWRSTSPRAREHSSGPRTRVSSCTPAGPAAGTATWS
jgi:LysM repeat protein